MLLHLLALSPRTSVAEFWPSRPGSGARSWSPKSLSGTQILELSVLPPEFYIRRKLASGTRAGNQSDSPFMGCSHPNHWKTSVLPSLFSLILVLKDFPHCHPLPFTSFLSTHRGFQSFCNLGS